MNIIICGAGRVGYTISKILTQQNHSVTVIDQSSEDIQKINENLDIKAIVGKATSPTILEKADTHDADMIIAVTRNDEINMLICQIASTLFNVPKKIARIRSQEYLNPKFSSLFSKENLPIDFIISPELEIAINPCDGSKYNVLDGEWVSIRSRRGEVEGRITYTDKMRSGEIFIPFVKLQKHAANFLTNAALDPNSRIPEYKVCAVRLEKV